MHDSCSGFADSWRIRHKCSALVVACTMRCIGTPPWHDHMLAPQLPSCQGCCAEYSLPAVIESGPISAPVRRQLVSSQSLYAQQPDFS